MYITRYIALENNTLDKFIRLHPTKAILYIYGATPVLQTWAERKTVWVCGRSSYLGWLHIQFAF